MKDILVMLAAVLLSVFIIVSCAANEPGGDRPEEAEKATVNLGTDAGKTVLSIESFSVYEAKHPLVYSNTHYFLSVVKDKETGREYIMVESSTGLTITPRLDKQKQEDESYF